MKNRNLRIRAAIVAALGAAVPGYPGELPGGNADFDSYVASAEARMRARDRFLLVDSDPSLNHKVAVSRKIHTGHANGSNPHSVPDAMIHDWVGTVYIPGVRLERVIRMLQDYDHRAQYFTNVVAESKLLCSNGPDRFRAAMRLKEPAAIVMENDIVWERVDDRHWQSRSSSTDVKVIGNDRSYLVRVNTYWRFSESAQGVYVEGEAITLSGHFGAALRALASLLGLSPEKSLKRTLETIRDTALKPGLEFAALPSGLPVCGQH